MKPTAGILVLCTGNSCRSQMAEGIFRDRLGTDVPVWSAGTEPAAEVHPLAREVMAEIGIDLAAYEPKTLDLFLGRVPVHTLVVVCDGAAKSCPTVWPGAVVREQWPFPDPAAARGSEEEVRAAFREVRDAIAARIDAWIASRPTILRS